MVQEMVQPWSKTASCDADQHPTLAGVLKRRLQSALYPYTLPIKLFAQFLCFAVEDVCLAVKP